VRITDTGDLAKGNLNTCVTSCREVGAILNTVLLFNMSVCFAL
jgi:hypothetical protein